MKVGDLVQYIYPGTLRSNPTSTRAVGTVIEFSKPQHPKEFQKVRVVTSDGVQDWIMQFCKVINSLP